MDAQRRPNPQELGIKPPEPITVFIPPEKAPEEMLKQVTVADGSLSVETPRGKIEVELYAFPATGDEPQIPFFKRIFEKKPEPPKPVQVAIEPSKHYGDFEKGRDIPLMGWYPYAVLQDGTRYGVAVNVPTELTQQGWSEQKERPRITTGGLFTMPATEWISEVEYEIKEVFRERKNIVIAVRVDGKYPLAQRQEKGWHGGIVNRELLLSGFRPAQKEEGKSYAVVDKRITEVGKDDRKAPGVGEEVKSKADIQDLIFTLISGEDVEAPEKEKGVVEVIVCEATEDEVSEVIKTPKPRLEIYHSPREWDQGLAFKSFIPGQTKFSEPKREKVTIGGIKDLKPIAAFRMVLVGENTTEGLEMKEVQPKAVGTSEPTDVSK